MNNLPVKPEKYISIGNWCNDSSKIVQMSNTIAGFIVQLSLYCGRKIESDDAVTYAGAFAQDLINEFYYLDTLEIKLILNAGVRGKWGEWFGLNPLTFYNWTVAYIGSDERAAYLRKKREIIPPSRQLDAKQPPTPEEMWKLVRDWVNRDYQNYCLWRKDKWEAEYNGTFGEMVSRSERFYPPHPLADLGQVKSNWLHDEGYQGTLAEIYAVAYAEGRVEF
jgi:hypothetical protein